MSAEQVGTGEKRGSSEACAWVVRGEPGGGEAVGGKSLVDFNLENHVVTLGWGDWAVDAPIAAFKDREILNRCTQRWGEANWEPDWRESFKSEAPSCIWRFCNYIHVGDLVVLPPLGLQYDDAWMAVGEVTGDAIRDKGQSSGAQLLRKVNWLAQHIPRANVPEDLQDSIWSPGSVFRIKKPDAYHRLLRIADPHPGGMSGDEAGVLSEDGLEVPEGAKTRRAVNRYERSSAAKRWRLEHDDYTCQVCDLKFEERYGAFARGYMHVHHVVPLSQIVDHENHKVNPEKDLVAVCPNCHAMLHHHSDKPCTVETLRQLMAEVQE